MTNPVSQHLSSCHQIPEEIWDMIAKDLDDTNLNNLFQANVNVNCTKAVLKLKNKQEMEKIGLELTVLPNLKPSKPAEVLSCIDLYQEILAQMHSNSFNSDLEFTFSSENRKVLQAHLKAFLTQKVASKILDVKVAISEKILSNTTNFKQIEDDYSNLKRDIVLEAMNHVIGSSKNPDLTVGKAIEIAARQGDLVMVRALLNMGELQNPYRSLAVKAAAEKGHIHVIHELLANVNRSDFLITAAVRAAAQYGYLEIVQTFLSNGSVLSEFQHGRAVRDAAEKGHLEILRILLSTKDVSDNDISWAFINAAIEGHLAIVQELFANRDISEGFRELGVCYAAKRGYLEIVRTILSKGKISIERRGMAVRDAALIGNLDIVHTLLENGDILNEERQAATSLALKGGHHHVAEYLNNH